MRKRLVPLAMAATVGLALTACTSGGGSDDSVDLEFVTWQMEEAGISDWWAAVIEEFEESHPGVTVTARHVASSDIAENLTNSFAADDPPAIIHLPTEVFPVFADEGFLEPLDDRLAETDILENWPEAQTLMQWDGQMQGVMIFGYPVDLYVNQAMLDEAGLTAPTTPAELVEVAAALTEGDVYGYGTVTAQSRDLFRQVSSHVVGMGGTWAADGAFQLDSPEVVAALENFRTVAQYSPPGIESAQKRELFLQGKIAMMMDGPFIIPMIEEADPAIAENISVVQAPFPTVSYYPANGLHIPASASDEERDLAWEFIELAASPEMQDLFVELYQSPAARSGAGADAETSALLDQFLADAPDSVGIIPDSVGVMAEFGTFDRYVQDGLMTMLTSDRPIPEIFDEVQGQLESAGIEP